MKSWAVAGSTPLPAACGASTSACGRAAGAPPTRCRPRRACSDPAARSPRARAPRARPRRGAAASVVAAASASTVVMPPISRWPRSDRGDRRRRRRRTRAAPRRRRARSCTTARSPSCVEHLTARPRSTSSSNSGCHSGTGLRDHQRRQQVVQVVGASSGSGVISSCTCSMASGSSAPIDARSTARPRRSVHRVGAPVLELLVVEERVRAGR